MAQVKDPVCGMMLDSDQAAHQMMYGGKTYYFCSTDCLRQFEANPARYAESPADVPQPSQPSDVPLERHEPRFTKAGGMIAPKFGAAGSGGAEYELLPEAHDKGESH